jgi:hypothetical protein
VAAQRPGGVKLATQWPELSVVEVCRLLVNFKVILKLHKRKKEKKHIHKE